MHTIYYLESVRYVTKKSKEKKLFWEQLKSIKASTSLLCCIFRLLDQSRQIKLRFKCKDL